MVPPLIISLHLSSGRRKSYPKLRIHQRRAWRPSMLHHCSWRVQHRGLSVWWRWVQFWKYVSCQFFIDFFVDRFFFIRIQRQTFIISIRCNLLSLGCHAELTSLDMQENEFISHFFDGIIQSTAKHDSFDTNVALEHSCWPSMSERIWTSKDETLNCLELSKCFFTKKI